MEKLIIKNIEKRVRKEVREHGLIEKGDSLLVIDDGSAEAALSLYMINKIFKGMPLEIEVKKMRFSLGKPEKGYAKVIVPWNCDLENDYFLSCIFDGSKMPYLSHYRLGRQRHMKLLLPLSEEEVEDSASHLKLRFKKKMHDHYFSSILKEHPDVRFALLNSSRSFENK
ncbi:MAG: hypothetical protein NDI94_02805 [Candidatus Woesearchaeota archaeon]|nr:hypothetical protein [Candidatus Woesearchaeota archaeon]